MSSTISLDNRLEGQLNKPTSITSLFQFKAHQFKAPFWQKLPPKKNWYKALFCRAEIYLLKKEVIFDCNWRLIWSDLRFFASEIRIFFIIRFFFIKKMLFFLDFWRSEWLRILSCFCSQLLVPAGLLYSRSTKIS